MRYHVVLRQSGQTERKLVIRRYIARDIDWERDRVVEF